MGDTLPLQEEGACLEGVSRRGRASPVRSPAASTARRWRPCAPSSDLSQDRLQDLRAAIRDCVVEGLTDRSRRPVPSREAAPDGRSRKLIVALKREYPRLGRAEDSRAVAADAGPAFGAPAISTVHAGARPTGARDASRPATSPRRQGHPFRGRTSRMRCGARTIRASSCWPIGATATRSPSPTSPAVSAAL
jgi:hypothetical protein